MAAPAASETGAGGNILSRMGSPATLASVTGNSSQKDDTDLECSVDVLATGFLVWHRLQSRGVVRVQARDDVAQNVDGWHRR